MSDAILGLDPGVSTGWALLDGETVHAGVFEMSDYSPLEALIDLAGTVVMESYRLYGHKAKAKIGSSFPEVEVIGVIKYLCAKRGKRLVTQPASHKAYFSDARLQEMGVYPRIIHARDAARHAFHFQRFGKPAGALAQARA